MSNSTKDQFLKIAEVAESLSISTRTVWRKAKTKEFPQPIHVGGATRWLESDLIAYIERLKRGRNK